MTENAVKLTRKMRDALSLIEPFGSWGMDAEDERADKFSEDGEPDTWNRLFKAGLAKQWRIHDDEFVIRITEAGRAALRKAGAL